MARTVLFSNSKIAAYINAHFEPVWQSVRKVPTVTIDFGDGHAVKRTLNGNVATYVCNCQLQVFDVLPGVYTPDAYIDRLEQFCLLTERIKSSKREDRSKLLSDYHYLQWQRLKAGKSPLRIAMEKKSSKIVLMKSSEADERWSRALDKNDAYKITALPEGSLEEWKHLSDDVRLNETQMRSKIHEHLFRAGNTETLASLSKWLYQDVLHADIDDPYFGLKSLLDNAYPFKEQSMN